MRAGGWRGGADPQDSSPVFPMVILLGLAALIRVRRSSLEEETMSCVFLILLHYLYCHVTNLLMCHLIY
jgi:hypothetical protein